MLGPVLELFLIDSNEQVDTHITSGRMKVTDSLCYVPKYRTKTQYTGQGFCTSSFTESLYSISLLLTLFRMKETSTEQYTLSTQHLERDPNEFVLMDQSYSSRTDSVQDRGSVLLVYSLLR